MELFRAPLWANGCVVTPFFLERAPDEQLPAGHARAEQPAGRIPTPHLDRLTREGVRFTDAHTPSAVCTATRYGLLTGRYPWRTRLTRGVVRGNGDALIEPGRATLGLWSPKPDL
jgi:arylsulfatase A-like enzyme